MPINANTELSDLNFTKLCGIIHKNTGITIGNSRKNLLLSRLRGHLRDLNAPDFKSYISHVTADANELQELINRVTTNKTYFYRTPRVWNHFRNVALQDFLAKKAKRPMRIWSAASSTGEEAHTAGIVLEEARLTHSTFDYSILGSDVSSKVLKVAEAGHYSEPAVAQFRQEQPDLFNAHIMGDSDTEFKVPPSIKSRIKFKLHNLQNKLKNTSAFDAVFLRNVLIYFNQEDQEGILRNICDMMPADGTLYIGESESLNRLQTDLEIVEPMVYRLRPGAGRSTT